MGQSVAPNAEFPHGREDMSSGSVDDLHSVDVAVWERSEVMSGEMRYEWPKGSTYPEF